MSDDPRWVEVAGVWHPRVAVGQRWRAAGGRHITVRAPAEKQPTDLRDGTRRWHIMDESPHPWHRDGRDLGEALIWARYELLVEEPEQAMIGLTGGAGGQGR